MLAPTELTLGLLAGGSGSRLGGCAKGLIEVEGRAALERLLELAPLAVRVVLIANDPAPYARFGLETCADVVADRGAPGGVVTALLRARTPWVLVVACDMPFVTAVIARALLERAADEVDVVVPERAGRLEPLAALYRASLGAQWLPTLTEEPSLQRLVRSVRFRGLTGLDACAFDSLNTPDDLSRHRGRMPQR